MEKNPSAFSNIHLNIRLLPGARIIKIPLTRESTASDVVAKCKEILNSDTDYLLAANFSGFEKQFGAQERLYHLVKKHVLWAGLDGQVHFFIRKKKKQVPSTECRPCASDAGLDRNNEKLVFKMMERETPSIICSSMAVEAGGEGRLLADTNAVYCAADGLFSPISTNSCDRQTMAEQQVPHNSSSESLSAQLNSMSYAELLRLADRQKRQIDANNSAVASKEMRLNSLRGHQQHIGPNGGDPQSILSARLHHLRHQIKTEDAQLQHLRCLRAEVEDERRRSVTARGDLQEARRIFAEKEHQLREAAGRVQELMRHLEIVRRRRLVLSKENQLKHLQSTLDQRVDGKSESAGAAMVELSNSISVHPAGSQSPHQYRRPKAAIEPFKIVPPSNSLCSITTNKSECVPNESLAVRSGDYLYYGSSSDYLHSKGFVTAFTAMEEALQQTTDTSCPSVVGVGETAAKIGYPPGATGRLTPANGPGSAIYSKEHVVEDTCADSPQSETHLPQPVIPKVNISINRRFQIANAAPLLYEERPPPDLIPANEKTKFNSFDGASTSGRIEENSAGIAVGNVASSNGSAHRHYPHHHHYSDTLHPRGEADKILFRNDTLRAAKRRSWAENHLPTATDEAEHIRLLLARAQQRGKSSLNLSWIFDQMTTSAGHYEYYNSRQQRSASVASSVTSSYPPPMPSQSYISSSSVQDDTPLEKTTQPPPPQPTLPPAEPIAQYHSIDDKDMEEAEPDVQKAVDHLPQKVHNDDSEMYELNDGMEEQLLINAKRQHRLANEVSGLNETDDDDDDERSAATVVEMEIISSDIQLKPPPEKGILRLKPKDEAERGRRIRFDILALLLDAALEGELDLVKSCASKVPNVSTCTEEGITALHNAICAGHYEIVRFLVEAGADVNAEDGDGWTPLHCAASCNNLPMVKFLIERGACIFATTTNDHETPADKCEEDEEGFDGCSQFLFGIQEKLGVLNGGRVYAAYDYEAEYEDELELKADESVLILRREDEKEKGWWWAKRENTEEEGYVPRNFLALYPRLAAQRAGAMVNPASPTPAEPTPAPEDQMLETTEKEEITSESQVVAEP